MSTAILTQGIKIFLKSKYVENKSIGLLDNATTATSDIRLIEQETAGTSELYMHGVLAAEGIGERSWSSDLSRGGAVATIESVSVEWDNTAQYFKSLQNLSIAIHGCKAHIVEFSKNVATGVVTETVVYRGIAKVTQWNETDYRVEVESDDRDANVSTQIDATTYPDASDDIVGNAIPVTFGTIDKAMLTRTADKITKYTGSEIKSTIFDPTDAMVFPVYSSSGTPALSYYLMLGNQVGAGVPTTLNLAGKYLYVVQGGSVGPSGDDYTGEYRKIASYMTTSNRVLVALEAPFPKTLSESTTALGDNQAWVSIVDLPKAYDLDVWKCKNFLDDAGAPTSTSLKVYSFSYTKTVEMGLVSAAADISNKTYVVREYANKFTLLPNASFTPNANKNKLTVESIRFVDNDPDNIDYFTVLPVVNPMVNTAVDLAVWDIDGSSDHHNYKLDHRGNGLYYTNTSSPTIQAIIKNYFDNSIVSQTGNVTDLVDFDGSTGMQFKIITPSTPSHLYGYPNCCFSLLFDFPELPDGFEWDDAYIIIKGDTSLLATGTGAEMSANFWGGSNCKFMYRKFIGYATQCVAESYTSKLDHAYNINDLPSFYASNTGYSNNENFYCDNASTNPLPLNVMGIAQLNMNLTGLDKYNSIYQGCVNIHNIWNINYVARESATWIVNVQELAICFRKKNSIKKNVFSYASGRVRDAAWRAGKVATDLLESPGDVIEHLCRLENWQDETSTVYNWGKAYCAEALIKTSGAGSFDDSELAGTNALAIARQITDYDSAWVNNLKQSICQQFGLGQYRNATGYECLAYIVDKAASTPTDTITLADIPDGMEPGEVQEPRAEDVYCYNLQFKYNYNYGSQKYDGLVTITNTQAASYDPAYVTGYTGGLKEALWTYAHLLFLKYGNVKQPPTEMTELSWVRNEALAGWIAFYVLRWQGKRRIQVPVVYSKVKTWDIFKHILLNLPHQTDGVDFECVIEKIKHDPHKNISILDLVMYDSAEYSFSSTSSDSSSSGSTSSSSASVSKSWSSGSLSSVSSDSSISSSNSSDSSASSDSSDSSSSMSSVSSLSSGSSISIP